MQGTRVRALVQEDPTCRGATKPMRHNYWACTLESTSHNYWARVPQLLSLHSRAHEPQLLSPHVTTTEVHTPRAHALQQEKPPQWEARAPQQRESPLAATRESLQGRPNAALKKKKKKKKKRYHYSIPSLCLSHSSSHSLALSPLLLPRFLFPSSQCPELYSLTLVPTGSFSDLF